MAQGIPKEMMMDTALVKELAEVAKDAALLHGVQMRIQETPNSSEVRRVCTDGEVVTKFKQLKQEKKKHCCLRLLHKCPVLVFERAGLLQWGCKACSAG